MSGLPAADFYTGIVVEVYRPLRSIFLAGPTFNLLPDDATALRALERIRHSSKSQEK